MIAHLQNRITKLVVIVVLQLATIHARSADASVEPTIPFPKALQDAGVTVTKMTQGQSNSLIFGNGDVYGIVWEVDSSLLLRITKNDIWDARLDTSKDGPLPKVNIRTGAITGSTGSPRSYTANTFPEPICAVALRIKSSKVVQGTLNLKQAVATITSGSGDKTDIRVLADRNVLLINTKESVSISPIRDGKTGKTDGVEWLHVTLPGDLDYNGMEYCVAVKGTENTKAISLVTSFDIPGGDVRSAAIALAETTIAEVKRSKKELIASHEKAWLQFWSRSGLEIQDRDLQNWWYRMLYFARTVSQAGGKYPVGLMPPLATDKTPWHADFHFNYNSWQPFWSVISVNHPELADPWIAYVDRLLPRAQWQAKEVYDCEGVFYSISHFLHEPDPADCKSVNKRALVMNPWGLTIGMVGMTAQNLWYKHLCDPDRAYLEAKIYPTLRETARFYLSFMKQCRKDDAGKILLGPTYSPEHGPMGVNNCPFDIAYVHYTFDAFDRASKEVGKDRALAEECLSMKALLADYPVALDTNGNPVVVDWAGCKYKEITEHNITVPASPVFPAEQVTWFSPEPLKELFRRTIKDTKHNGNNSHIMFNIAKARLSMPEAVQDAKTWFKSRELPNGLFVWQGHMHGTFMPESIGVAALIAEFLMQSVGDVVRVFPCWPEDQNASFKNLRAQGGFLVSADCVSGTVQQVSIIATVGGNLRFLSPWKTILVNGKEMVLDANGIVNIPTKTMETYVFKSGRP